MDADSGSVMGDIPDTQEVHGVAVVEDAGRGLTSNGSTSTVTIFDLKTLQTIGHAKTGKRPDGIIYDPASRLHFRLWQPGLHRD